MVIGNAMTAAAVALNRLGDEVADAQRQIEGTLGLGATGPSDPAAQAPWGSLRSAVIPLIDSTKTTGLIFFPGTMVGMLLAGAAPVDAVRLQLVLLYVLLGGVSIAAPHRRRPSPTARSPSRPRTNCEKPPPPPRRPYWGHPIRSPGPERAATP